MLDFSLRPVSAVYIPLDLSFSAMGKTQKKTGKGRIDKYYKLAKYVPFIS